MKIKTQFNENYKGTKGTVNKLPSLTQPDMSLTIPELLKYHTRGLDPDIQWHQDDSIHEDTLIPHITDMTDIDEIKRNNAEQKKLIEDEIKEQSEKNYMANEASEAIKAIKTVPTNPNLITPIPTSTNQPNTPTNP